MRALQAIKRTANAGRTHITDVRVDHGRADVMMAEQFLNGANIMASFEQVGGEAMPKRMTNSRFRQFGCFDGLIKRLLNGRLMNMVTS